MTTTLTGALIGYLAALEPTVGVYRDRAPELAPGASPVTVLVVQENVSTYEEHPSDVGAAGREVYVAEEVQIDLYQPHHDASTRAIAEDDLPDRMHRHLARAVLTTATPRVYRFRVLTASRTPDLNANIVRTTYRCRVHRAL